MATALSIFSLVIVVSSTAGALFPRKLVKIVQGVMARELGFWFAVGVRILLAVLLWFSADVSRTPGVFKVLAVIALIVPIVFLIAGRVRLGRFVDYFTAWPPWAIRVGCLAGIAFGGFLLWSISPAILSG